MLMETHFLLALEVDSVDDGGDDGSDDGADDGGDDGGEDLIQRYVIS